MNTFLFRSASVPINMGTFSSSLLSPKIEDLIKVSERLNDACRKTNLGRVLEILNKEKTTGRIAYILRGVRTLDGKILKNLEGFGYVTQITRAPLYIVRENLDYYANKRCQNCSLKKERCQIIGFLLRKGLQSSEHFS